MKKLSNKSTNPKPYGLLRFQFEVTLLITLFAWGFGNAYDSYSAFLGGMICVAAGFCFLHLSFRQSKRDPASMVKDLYLGELCKLLTTALAFLVILKFGHVQPLPFFIGYILTQLAFWVSPLIYKPKYGVKEV